MKTLSVKCDKCDHPNKRLVKLVDPDTFSPTGTKSVLSQYWCSKCNAVQVVRYEFTKDKKGNLGARVKARIDSSSVSTPKQADAGFTVRPRAAKPGSKK